MAGERGGAGLAESSDRVVIVGGGHAGGSMAAFLRQFGWTGGITVLGEEPLPPYQRPPLSKAWLKGEADAESLSLRAADFYLEQDIELRLGERVAAIDREARQVVLTQGRRLGYDRLVLATGAQARKLAVPGAGLEGVLELRTAEDAEALKSVLRPGARLVVIGGGYVGLEAAASARALGAEVTLVEREARPLARVACGQLSEFFLGYHRDRGVKFVLDAQVEALVGEAGAVVGVRLAGGETIACEAVLVGVGARAADDLARAAGLECAQGVVVDLAARSSDPLIYAIGDCSWRPLPLYETSGRLESVPNALEQAKQAASDICGRPPPAAETPWFWSDQYDLKLQIAGLELGASQSVLRGDPSSGQFSVFHLTAENRVQCVEAVNRPADFMGGRQLIGSRQPVALERLRDGAIPMKSVVES